jgi:hypothetical protein
MASTTFSGPIRAGTIREGASENLGNVVLSQTDTFTFAIGETQTSTGIVLPASSQIVAIHVDVDTVWNSSVSDALEIGDGTDQDAYGDVADIQAGGRTTASVDATQAAAIDNIGTSDVTVSVTVVSSGTAENQGSARITVLYVQN